MLRHGIFIIGIIAGLFMISGGATAEPLTYRVGVDGLQCPFCAFGVERELIRIEGVDRIEVNLDEGVIIISMADDASLDETSLDQAIASAEKAVRRAVDNAGFTLRGFERVHISK